MVRRALFAVALVLVALPAGAESRTVQSGLTKPFPSIGDAVADCRDPANTQWIEIVTGKLWEREVEGRMLRPSFQDVVTGVQGFFHTTLRQANISVSKTGMRSTLRLKAAGMASTWCVRAIPAGDATGFRPSICRVGTITAPCDVESGAGDHLATQER